MAEQSFADMFKKGIEESKIAQGEVVKGTIIGIDDKFVLVDVGLKSEGPVPVDQFMNLQGELDVNIGDEVDVVIEMVADAFGETRLSREKARRAAAWVQLVESYKNNETVTGLVTGKVKGGFTVEIQSVRAFLPGSLVDVRPIADSSDLEGKVYEFKIIKVDDKRSNIVVSRRAVIEAESSAERSKLLDNLEEGQVVKGLVKNLTDYGAFIDLGGIDGLLHITDIAWKRVKLPSEVLKIGDEVKAVVLKFDKERGRVSLGMKQLAEDPWENIKARYPVDTRLNGKVTNLTDYGCFVELEDGIEGLVHMSEMDWTNKNVHPSKLVKVGEAVDVIVLDIDEERRRISLGMKQCRSNPWQAFADTHKENDRIVGKIRSITDFGIFIGLDGDIDGLVHLSDISWDEPGEKAIHNYKKGDEIDAVVLAIDPERERISLGIKQLQDDPFNNYAETNPKGSIVKGKITEVDEKQVLLELAPEVVGRLKAAEMAVEKVADAREQVNVGDEIEVRVISVNRKDRVLNVSIKALVAGVKEDTDAVASDQVVNTTLGDLLKEQMEQNNHSDE